MILYFVFILILSVFFFFLSIVHYYLRLRVVLEWIFLRFHRVNLEFFVLLDWVSLVFISIVLIISSIVIIYRIVYIEGDSRIRRFYNLIFLFVLSIILMIISPNVFSVLFGWDGLGVRSYCLVIYYQNYSSYNSGIITVLINRIGDVGILIAISIMLIYGRWRIFMLERNKWIIYILLLARVTKRAQIPFSSWLPKAMAAPTPISSLVHSSTLVTAGVYLIIRFRDYLEIRGLRRELLWVAVLTMFISGVKANFEIDLKKIIALSTLRQLGFMIIIISIGDKNMSFYHLLTHALFKSLLFLCAGILIHSINNRQDIRMYGGLVKNFPFTTTRFFIASLALCGFPFIAGFYSKDLIIEFIYDRKINILIFMVVIISLSLTVSYSLRLFYYMFFGELKFNSYVGFEERRVINFAIVVLILFRIIGGATLNWLFFFDKTIYLGLRIKLLTTFICMVGIFIWLRLRGLKRNIYMLYFFRSMGIIDSIYRYISNPLLNFRRRIDILEKTWVEYIVKGAILKVVYNIFFSLKIYRLIYKIFIIVLFVRYVVSVRVYIYI